MRALPMALLVLILTALGVSHAKAVTGVNVVVVIDTTAPMTSVDPNCGLGSNATRDQCALAGLQAMLGMLNPATDHVTLEVFPGRFKNFGMIDRTCSTSRLLAQNTQWYNNSPNYTVAYARAPNDRALLATVGALAGCAGTQAAGGVGTYLAGPLIQAQADVASMAMSYPDAGNYIIVFSDGSADAQTTATPFRGSITGTTLTVTACGIPPLYANGCTSTMQQGPGPLAATDVIEGTGVTDGTAIVSQTDGTTGGAGHYVVSPSQTVAHEAMLSAVALTLNGTDNYVQNVNECQQAIDVSNQGALSGVTTYSIGYAGTTGDTQDTTTCVTDSSSIIPGLQPWLSGCETMSYVANSPGLYPDLTKFYSNNALSGVNCPLSTTQNNLVTLFETIAAELP